MELQKGVCFLCRDGKVIKSSQAEKAFKIISSLFSKKILNTAEFNNIQSSLKLCPICYHKLVIMKHTNENIKTDNFKDDVHNKCLLCKSKQLSFKINDWPHFGKISDDLVSKDEDAYIVCSECLFYLDTRHHIKTKLFSKYPQLKVKPPTENEAKRRKSKYRSEVKSDSAVVSVSRRRLVRGIINISSDEDVESPKKQSLKLDFLKKLKPLRHSESFRRQQIVKSDSKFLKQIPYVLLETSNFSSERINNKNILNEIDDKETPVHKIHKKNDIKNSKSRKSGIPEIKTNCSTTKIKPRRLCPKSIKIKRELRKHDVGKRLVVNLSKVDILQHSRNYKPDLEIENLIDKFNVLQRPTTGITGRIPEESSKDNFNGLLKETESNVEVKAKRKSVSFAEDKNVEIEYFQNDSKPNSIDSFEESTKNDSTEEMLKKQNKDIDSSESANKTIKTQKRTLGEEHEINSTDSEVGMESEIEFDESPRVSNTNIINNDNVSNADLIDNDDENVGDEKTIKDKIVEDTELDSDTHKKICIKIRRKSVNPDNKNSSKECDEFVVEREVTEKVEVTHKPKRDKPKPLSKKKAKIHGTNMENTPEYSKNSSSGVNSENNIQNRMINSESLSKENQVSDPNTNLDIADEADKNNDNSSLTNEEGEICNKDGTDKLTDTNIESEHNLSAKDESYTKSDDTVDAEKQDTDKNEQSSECKSPTSDDKNECIFSREEDEDTIDSISGIKSSNLKITSAKEGTQSVEKCLEDTEGAEDSENCSKNENGGVPVSSEEGEKIHDECKESNEVTTGDDNTVIGSNKKNENNEELGISEEDKNNINSILTDMFSQQEQPGEWRIVEKDSDVDVNRKRKMSDDELNSSTDKKKKKVTFSENFT